MRYGAFQPLNQSRYRTKTAVMTPYTLNQRYASGMGIWPIVGAVVGTAAQIAMQEYKRRKAEREARRERERLEAMERAEQERMRREEERRRREEERRRREEEAYRRAQEALREQEEAARRARERLKKKIDIKTIALIGTLGLAGLFGVLLLTKKK